MRGWRKETGVPKDVCIITEGNGRQHGHSPSPRTRADILTPLAKLQLRGPGEAMRIRKLQLPIRTASRAACFAGGVGCAVGARRPEARKRSASSRQAMGDSMSIAVILNDRRHAHGPREASASRSVSATALFGDSGNHGGQRNGIEIISEPLCALRAFARDPPFIRCPWSLIESKGIFTTKGMKGTKGAAGEACAPGIAAQNGE